MDRVDERELQTALANRLDQWKLAGKTLERSFEFADFKTAMEFVHQVAEQAELFQHHPDIAIHYNRVQLSLSSHDAGGITRRDLILAGKINEIAPVYKERRKRA